MNGVRTLNIREEFLDRIIDLWKMGANKNTTIVQFVGYIIELGAVKYEKTILPIEAGTDYPPHTGVKIIPFPGGKA